MNILSVKIVRAFRGSKNAGDLRPGRLDSYDLTDPFATAVYETPMPMLVTDATTQDNPIVFANPAFCRMTGYLPHEILGRNCRFLQGPQTDPEAVRQIAAALRAEEPIEIEIRNYRKDGSPFWNRLMIAPVHDETGAIAYFIGNQIDITIERERMAELQFQNDALTEFTTLLADRTADLDAANEKLQAEIKERERVKAALQQLQKMEAIGQLTGGIAHDFNNLLGGILGSLELLRRNIPTGEPDELKRYTETAIASAQRAASLTQRLLAFARRQPLKLQRTDVNRLMAGMQDMLQRTLGPSIDVTMALDQALWPGCCDPSLLENAVLNLAINARDAMPGGGRLTIATANISIEEGSDRATRIDLTAGQYITISVTDTGIGMTAEVIERAFEPFFTTKPIGEGTGLGLPMVYGFVKQSGGTVRVHSKPGRGTTFKLYLPCNRVGPEDEVAEETTAPAPGAQTRTTARILIVDDEETFRMVVSETLQDMGFTTIQAADGAAALKVLHSDPGIDLLVTDIGLPGMDGQQLATAARLARPDLPIVFITGYASEAVADDGLKLGAGMALLNKPFTLPALEQAVHTCLGRSDASGA
jgi:PAS domain S-box-containing protein